MTCALSLVGIIGVVAAGATPVGELAVARLPVERTGVHSVSFEELAAVTGWPSAGVAAHAVSFTHRGRALSHRLRGNHDAVFGPKEELEFLVDDRVLEPPVATMPAGRSVVLLMFSKTSGLSEAATGSPTSSDQPATRDGVPLEIAPIRRHRRFGEDRVRVALTQREAEAGVRSPWYHAVLTERRSSRLRFDLGPLSDRRRNGEAQLRLVVHLLGWSELAVPHSPPPGGQHSEGDPPDHHVDVLLNGELLSDARFDGRREYTLVVDTIPEPLLRDDGNQLELTVHRRVESDGGEPLIDSVYVDRVELSYLPNRLVQAPGHLVATPAARPRWLPGTETTLGDHLWSSAGWIAGRSRTGAARGWRLPPIGAHEELYLVAASGPHRPLAVEPVSRGALEVRNSVEYLMIAPPDLLAALGPLAQLHRARGLEVAGVDAFAIYDRFGDGERSPLAIRRFLEHHLGQPGALESLRFLLLVGDADWAADAWSKKGETHRAQPHSLGSQQEAGRNLVPTGTHFSRHGPATSDHVYATTGGSGGSPRTDAQPRYAVGRLPVATVAELETVVAKIRRHVAATGARDPQRMLLLNDASVHSVGRSQRMVSRLAELPLDIVRPDLTASSPPTGSSSPGPDRIVAAAFESGPGVVYFGGHGGRFTWELGDRSTLAPEAFFDRDDVRALQPSARLPIAIAVSCATAPFDHPIADSIGELMVLLEERGAIGYVGGSARQFTPRTFGDVLVRELIAGKTVGEALVEAKRRTDIPDVSFLYNLLGDPALPLR